MSSELDAFRLQWLEEVRSRKGLHPTSDLDKPTKRDGPKLQSALDYYRLAVDYEQHGKFNDALMLYRRAFKLDPAVDRLFHQQIAAVQRQTEVGTSAVVSEPALDKEVTAAPISAIVEQLLAVPPVYAPEDETRDVPIAYLPDEVFVHVLVELALSGDVASVERVALVCRKLRLVTLDSTIWRSVISAPQPIFCLWTDSASTPKVIGNGRTRSPSSRRRTCKVRTCQTLQVRLPSPVDGASKVCHS